MNKAKKILIKDLLSKAIENSYSKGDTLIGCAHRELIGIPLGNGTGAPRSVQNSIL